MLFTTARTRVLITIVVALCIACVLGRSAPRGDAVCLDATTTAWMPASLSLPQQWEWPLCYELSPQRERRLLRQRRGPLQAAPPRKAKVRKKVTHLGVALLLATVAL